MPVLTLGQATHRTPPTERGLGQPDRSYALDDALVHLTWPHHPGVQALERAGHPLGWIELDTVDDQHDAWVTIITGHLLADVTDHQPLLSANPADAITLLRLALAPGLAS